MAAHILLPGGRRCRQVLVNLQKAIFAEEQVGESLYVNFKGKVSGKISIQILFEQD